MRFGLILLLVLFSLSNAITTYPIKVSVQTGDTFSFVPFIKDWDTSATMVIVEKTAPIHGQLQTIPNWFDSVGYYSRLETKARTRTPKNYPGFRYVPSTGFTGLDSFSFRIIMGTDTSGYAKCRIRVTPPEPGQMTVLLVVNQILYETVQVEVNQLKTDLENEGYKARIVPFSLPQSWNSNHAKQLWDTLVAEYDNPSRMLAGAILIGRLPYLGGSGIGNVNMSSAYWCMSKWEQDFISDTTILGYRAGYTGGYNYKHYTPAFLNIWVSQMTGAGASALGNEAELVKRILNNNHDYRTGKSRLPHSAYVYTMYSQMNSKIGNTLNSIWPSFIKHEPTDSIRNPLKYEYKLGGEMWNLVSHGNYNYYNAILNGSSKNIWRLWLNDIVQSHASIRFLLTDACHVGGIGGINNQHLLVKNSGCVLAMGSTDYVTCGFFLFDTSSSFPPYTRTRNYLAGGDRWGRAWLRGNGWTWGCIFHGDLSLKPKMGPSNQKPVITGLNALKKSGLDWDFTVTASDADDMIVNYDWYHDGYRNGVAQPTEYGRSLSTFSYSYATAKICTVRVEVVDSFKARDYATVIIKTDSGVISQQVYSSNEKSIPKVRSCFWIEPNPFNPNTRLIFQPSIIKGETIRFEVLTLGGRCIYLSSVESGKNYVEWNGNDLNGRSVSSGVYLFKLSTGNKTYLAKAVLAR